MDENTALIARAEALLERCTFYGYEWAVRQSHGGVHLQATYSEPDIYTGATETQHTRRWLLSPAMTDSEIVQTAFKCALTSFEHRAREGFTFRGARIFGPHFDVNDLVSLCATGRENAGGRR